MSAVEPPPFLEALREELSRVAEADARAAEQGPARRRPSIFRLHLRLPRVRLALPVTVMLLALLVGVGVTATGVLSPSDSNRGGQVALQNGDDFAPPLLRTLSLLQQLPEPADALPPGLSDSGLADAAIRLAPPAPPSDVGAPFDRDAWVVPSRDDPDRLLLLVETESGFGGAPGRDAADVAAGRAYIYTEAQDGDGISLVGLAPDGVDRVTVDTREGGIELPVRDNTFGAVLRASGVLGVSWSGMDEP